MHVAPLPTESGEMAPRTTFDQLRTHDPHFRCAQPPQSRDLHDQIHRGGAVLTAGYVAHQLGRAVLYRSSLCEIHVFINCRYIDDVYFRPRRTS